MPKLQGRNDYRWTVQSGNSVLFINNVKLKPFDISKLILSSGFSYTCAIYPAISDSI